MNIPGTSGRKRSLPTDKLCFSKRVRRRIDLLDESNVALVENMIPENSSGSEVDDNGDGFYTGNQRS